MILSQVPRLMLGCGRYRNAGVPRWVEECHEVLQGTCSKTLLPRTAYFESDTEAVQDEYPTTTGRECQTRNFWRAHVLGADASTSMAL